MSFVVLDSISRKPIDNCNINLGNNKFLTTNINGEFKVNDIKLILTITNIEYETKILDISKFSLQNINMILLKIKTEFLNEVLINNKKIIYSWLKTIKSEQYKSQFFGFQFGTENCRFVKNLYNKEGIVNSLTLYLKKVKNGSKTCKLCKIDYIANYNIKFYEYDSIKNLPGDEILKNDLIIYPKNKNYKLKINLDSLNIRLPKNGICIGVEIVNLNIKKVKNAGSIIAPVLKFTEITNRNECKAWIRYRNEGWKFINLQTRDKKGKLPKQNALITDLEIKLKK